MCCMTEMITNILTFKTGITWIFFSGRTATADIIVGRNVLIVNCVCVCVFFCIDLKMAIFSRENADQDFSVV